MTETRSSTDTTTNDPRAAAQGPDGHGRHRGRKSALEGGTAETPAPRGRHRKPSDEG
ncbi:hypothetical protein H1V43_26365 [Streptomyces sp. PSKA54]|uniref:Uncharacterized protein n=1 Tax=Streptomyces himalayensis subsp. aureolus TaxID=2758039 RepID=A0A7W2HI90_9ACTN|nr:hypothetical protein [Streptomyces himalayensis]MBA4864810.1 hypothetical protein [Streptomyces himalayensis subsp. aureolus]